MNDAEIRAALEAAAPPDKAELIRAEVARWVREGEVAYLAARRGTAQRLGIPVGKLDRLIEAQKPKAAPQATTQGAALTFPSTIPHAEAQDGAALLTDVDELFTRYLVLPPGAAEALATWTLYTYAADSFDVAVWLALLSPRERCGKTRTLELVAALARRAFVTSGVTSAAFFRTIEAYAPVSVFVDEFDQFAENEELRCCLNSAYRREAARVTRCIKTADGGIEPRTFSTFAPLVLAKIGSLDGRWRTVALHSITIPMKRRTPREPVEKLRWPELRPKAAELRSRLERWAADNRDALAGARPAEVPGLDDRAAEIVLPLLAVADAAGGEWPAAVRASVGLLLAGRAEADDSATTLLLQDVRAIFDANAVDRIGSRALIERLNALEDRPWPTWARGRPLDQSRLARLLKPFGIGPRTIRFADGTRAKGYPSVDFSDAWNRYLPPAPVPAEGQNKGVTPNPPHFTRDTVTTARREGANALSEPLHEGAMSRLQNATLPYGEKECHGVTAQKGGTRDAEADPPTEVAEPAASEAVTCPHGADPDRCDECQPDLCADEDSFEEGLM